MDQKILLDIITPSKVLVKEEEVETVILPGKLGEFGVLPGHMPLLSSLHPGELRYKDNSHIKRVAVTFGFAEVLEDRVSVLVEAAEKKEEIQIERARSAMERARNRLEDTKAEDIDFARAEAALKKAMARLKVAEKK